MQNIALILFCCLTSVFLRTKGVLSMVGIELGNDDSCLVTHKEREGESEKVLSDSSFVCACACLLGSLYSWTIGKRNETIERAKAREINVSERIFHGRKPKLINLGEKYETQVLIIGSDCEIIIGMSEQWSMSRRVHLELLSDLLIWSFPCLPLATLLTAETDVVGGISTYVFFLRSKKERRRRRRRRKEARCGNVFIG